MTAPTPKTKVPQLNLNTLLLILTIFGGLVPVMKVILPLAVVPEKVEKISTNVSALSVRTNELQRGQDIQAEALKTLIDVSRDGKEMRRDVDRHAAELQDVRRRLDRLENH